MRSWCIVAFAGFLMWIGGCVRMVQPILKEEQLTVDPALAGKWVSQDGKTMAEVAVPAKDSKDYAVVYYDEKGKPAHFVMRLGKLENLTVVDVTVTEPAPDENDFYKAHLLPLHSFLITTATATKLTVQTMAQDWLKKYLEQHPGELATIQVDNQKDNFIVTASTDDFQKFLLKHWKDEGALGDPGIFVRPGDPSTQPTTKP